MEISWQTAIKLYWPYLAMTLISAIGGIYTYGYACGQRSLLTAAEASAREAKGDGTCRRSV